MDYEELIEYTIKNTNILQEDKKDEILDYFKNLIKENHELKVKLETLQQDLQENYRRIPINEQYEVYDHDFI